MKTSHYEEITTKHVALSSLLSKIADEDRKPNDTEKAELSQLRADIDTIKSAWESDGRKRFLEGLERKNETTGPLVLKADQSFADTFKGTYDQDHERASVSRYLRGYLTGDWGGSSLELKTMASSAAGAILPTPIAGRIIDLARNQAVVFRAGATTVPMSTPTLKIARLTGDVTAGWYSSGERRQDSRAGS